MKVKEARRVVADPNATAEQKAEAQAVLGATNTTQDVSDARRILADTTASEEDKKRAQAIIDDESTDPAPAGASPVNSYPNTGESLDKNRPSTTDMSAAAGAATADLRKADESRPTKSYSPQRPVAAHTRLSGEVDSASSEKSQGDTAHPNAGHPTAVYSDDRGYSNTRRVAVPQVIPTVNVPVDNMINYVDDTGVRIGRVERGQEASEGEIVVCGAKEFIVVSGLLGDHGNTIAVRQNLPAAI